MTLDDLVGIHTLDARGEYVRKAVDPSSVFDDDALVVLLRIDGVVYAFQEDPSDGYRSCMRTVRIADDQDLSHPLAEFPPMVCNFAIQTQGDYHTTDEILYAVNEHTNLVVLMIGTSNTDDYYPSFVSSWMPEGKPLHQRETGGD